MAIRSVETDKTFPGIGGSLSAIESRVIKKALAGKLGLQPGVDRELPKRVILLPDIPVRIVDGGGSAVPYGVRARKALVRFN